MKRFVPSTASQWKLPLIDVATLTLPEQKELAQALMDLLIQVARQLGRSASHTAKGDSDGRDANF